MTVEPFDLNDDELEPWLVKPFLQTKLIKDLRVRTDFRMITVLALEKQGIQKIFEVV